MKKNYTQDEPRCVKCSSSFYFRDPTSPYGSKCPHILQCGHSVCEGCLTSELQKNCSLTCPVCTKISDAKKFSDPKNLKKSEILSLREEFPLNVYAVGQVALKRNRSKTEENLIKFCPKNKKMTDTNTENCNECNARVADCSCRQCETDLCSPCFMNIHQSVTLRKHEKLSLQEKQSNELFEENMCKKHKGLFLNIFCKDCEIFVCKECLVDDNHLEHRCIDVYKQNQDKLPEFSELFDEVNDILKQLYATRKKLQQPGNRSQVQDQEALKVERQVQAHYGFLHGILQRQEEELLRKIRCVSETAQKSLENVMVDLEKNIKEVESILALSNCTISSNKIKEFPLECLIEKLRNITGTPCYLVLNDEENSKFQFYEDPSILETLAGHCAVNVPSKRVYELRSKSDLPDSYKLENLKDIPNPFLKADLKQLRKDGEEENAQKAMLNAISTPPLTEVKTKPQDFLPKNKANYEKNKTRESLSGSLLSISSQESYVDRIRKVQPLAPGTSEIVQIVHFLSPNSFYVQRKTNLSEIESIRKYFSKNANRNKDPPPKIEKDHMYLVYFSKDNNWYRGRVLKIYGHFCDVFFVDYGNTEVRVPKNKLRDIPEKYTEIPDQALHCGLYNCTPVGGQWQQEAYGIIMNIASNRDLSMYVEVIHEKSRFHEVHLRRVDNNNASITDSLIFYGFATTTESTGMEEGMFQPPVGGIRKNAFKNPVIKEKEVFDGQVTHINTPSNFYMQKIADAGDLMMKLMNELYETYSKYGANQGLVFTPTMGMPVAAKFSKDGSWYRGIVVNIPESRKVQVKYVDFGNIEIVQIENIRELQPKFLRVAAQALKCSLNDIAPKHPKGWPTSAKNAFEKLVLNKGLMRVYVEKVKDDNSLDIVLYETLPTKYINISGVLVKRGHAISTGLTSAQSEYACRPDYEEKHNHVELAPSDSESVYSEFSGISKVNGLEGNGQNEARVERKEDRLSRDFPSSLEPQDKPDQDYNGRVKVEILKVITASEIYITLGNTPKMIKNLVKEMTEFYATKEEEEDHNWSVGDLCAVLKQNDGKWYRGVITEETQSDFKVFVKDIVEVLVVGQSSLRTLESKFCQVRDGSTKIHLGGLKVPAGLKTWPSSSSDYLRLFVEDDGSFYIEKMGDVVNDSLPVRLWRRTQKQGGPLDPLIDEWCNVNESLITLGFALPDHAFGEKTCKATVEENDEYVKSWLDTTHQANYEPHPLENNEIEVVAEAPYVTNLDKDEVLTLRSVRSVRSTRERTRSRASRGGRSTLQKASYIPGTMGYECSEMVTEWKPAVPFKKLNFFGQPTYVDYECNIYIQDIDECRSTLELLEKAFMSLFENSQKRPYEEEYLEGQICVAFFEITRKWYRGKVQKVKPEHIEVLFVDYGNVEELQPEQLRKQVTMGHIPIQCHKCRTEGIIPISPDNKWPVHTLDFIHNTVVEQRCEVLLKPPTEMCDDYILLSLKLPGGQDLLETLLSMHYATYVVDCETIGLEDEEEIIVDQEIQLAFSNNQASKALALEINNVCANLEPLRIHSSSRSLEKDDELIEDHVKYLQSARDELDWNKMIDMAENYVEHPASPAFISELDTTPTMDLKFRNMLLPDSIVEFTVEIATICNHKSVKVIILKCDDLEVMAHIDEFNKLQSLIQEEATSLPILSYPVKNLVCIGCYTEDNVWYRAVIKDVLPDNLISVHYVDYGNVEEVPLSRLREIKPEWTLAPVQAIQVTLYNVREGPHYEKLTCYQAYVNCLMSPPYTMSIESRFPMLQVELYNEEGELAYKPLLDAGLIIKD